MVTSQMENISNRRCHVTFNSEGDAACVRQLIEFLKPVTRQNWPFEMEPLFLSFLLLFVALVSWNYGAKSQGSQKACSAPVCRISAALMIS
jgi:hypothetical protein